MRFANNFLVLVFTGLKNIVHLLLNAKADPNATDKDGTFLQAIFTSCV